MVLFVSINSERGGLELYFMAWQWRASRRTTTRIIALRRIDQQICHYFRVASKTFGETKHDWINYHNDAMQCNAKKLHTVLRLGLVFFHLG